MPSQPGCIFQVTTGELQGCHWKKVLGAEMNNYVYTVF